MTIHSIIPAWKIAQTEDPGRLQSARSHFSCVQLFATLWTIAHQTPLSMGFSRQEYWSGLPFPTRRDLPDPEIEPASLMSLISLMHWQVGSLPLWGCRHN